MALARSLRYPPASVQSNLARLAEVRDQIRLIEESRGEDWLAVAETLATYHALRVAGVIEKARNDCSSAYLVCTIHDTAALARAQYSIQRARSTGIAPSNLVTYLRTFRDAWGDEFDGFISITELSSGETIAQRLGTLKGIRDKLAHGEAEISSRRFVDANAELARIVCNWLSARFTPGQAEHPVGNVPRSS